MNPFFNIPEFPAFDLMTPAAADEALATLLPEAMKSLEQFETSLAPTWDEIFHKRNEAFRPLERAWSFLCHLKSVVDTPEWRVVQEKYQPEIVAFSQKNAQSKRVYNGYQKILAEDNSLSSVKKRILKSGIQNMELSGVGLPDDQKEMFNQIELKLSQDAITFSNHLRDATNAFSLTLSRPEEADGMPATLRAVTAQAAAPEGSVVDPEKGPWKITLDYACFSAFMKNSKNRDAREKLFRAYVSRASSGELDNRKLIEDILWNRLQLAQQLGFANYAELSLSLKMAKKIPTVDQLLNDLAAASILPAKKERSLRAAFAQENGFTEPLKPWDVAYWTEQLREASFSYSDEELQQYFQFPRVLQGLFSLSQRLFGISIQEASGEVPVWHPDVRFFRVFNEQKEWCASFYLDPYSRPESKQGGAWMNEFQTRERKMDGTSLRPIAVLVCNQTPPTGELPSLMRFDEVLTLFHEFGHALQNMLTQVEIREASGINGIEWDAVEIASQFMENWCYDKATLKGISCHIETGESIPDALYEKIVAAKNFMAASAMVRQLEFAKTDLDLYARYPRPDWPNAEAVSAKNRRELELPEVLPEDHFLCSFAHIFAGGYAAGYYSYKWSEVISADLFAAFEEVGLENDLAIQKMGRKYRDTFLALGGGTAPDEVFRLFRGRDPSIEPILRHAGLK